MYLETSNDRPTGKNLKFLKVVNFKIYNIFDFFQNLDKS